jgi:hypothetical protein
MKNSGNFSVNSQQSTANSQQPTVNSQQPTVNSQQSTVHSYFPLKDVIEGGIPVLFYIADII